MVEVFKTDVQQEEHAERLLDALKQTFPGMQLSFDLDDCDKILRVEGEDIPLTKVVDLMTTHGYSSCVLES